MIKRLFLFLALTVLVLSACTDNDSFSSNPSCRLTFSRDTVRMDTLFSGEPSSTYHFWVYNHSGDGLRISQVRQERGQQSGFRVNVDGTFLNPAVSDLELRKGDSLRVFVEVTTPENLAATPQLVEDNLLFTLESGVVQQVNLRTHSWDAVKHTSWEVTTDMTINGGQPIVLFGDGLVVKKGATLTLQNTTLFFHAGAGLRIEGKLIADNVLFRGDRLDHMFDYLPYDRLSGQWRGITLPAKSEGIQLKNCEIHAANDGLWCDSTKVELTQVTIQQCKGFGLYTHDSDVKATACQFANTLNDCVAILGGTATLDYCTMAQFYALSAQRGAALRFNSTEQSLTLSCTNSLLTGYDDDVLKGYVPSETLQYVFQNCLLRTPEEQNAETFKDILWEKPSDALQGAAHFRLVDSHNMLYDFRLKDESPALSRGLGRRYQQ